MDIVLYYTFSILETLAMMFLMFRLFKIELLPFHMFFASFIMSFTSQVIRTEYQLPELDVFIQMLLLFCFVWLLFRIHIFYATIMTGMAYQAYFLIQTSYYFGMDEFDLFSTNNGLPILSAYSTYILQSISALTAIGIGMWINKKRKGFDFVPDRPRGNLNLKKIDKIMFFLNVPTIFIISSTIYLTGHLQQIYVVIPIIYALSLFVYLYMSYKKDREL